MKITLKKIALILITAFGFSSCNVVKRVKRNDYLLTDTEVRINNKVNRKEDINNLLLQKQNVTLPLVNYPLRLHIYNLARDNRDSLFETWLDNKPHRRERKTKRLSAKQLAKLKETALGLNSWLRKTGEAPVILDSLKTLKSKTNLENYFFKNGWFDRVVTYDINKNKNQKATLTFDVTTGQPYKIDSISTRIASKVIDSLYETSKQASFIKKGEQFKEADFADERQRLNTTFRNSGVYHFTQDYIRFTQDTSGVSKKVDVQIEIANRIIRNEDSIARIPFKIFKIKDVNIITNAAYRTQKQAFQDSIIYDGYNLYSYDQKIKYRPKALTDAVLITKGNIFKDIDRIRTYRYLNELKTFKYPRIDYDVNEQDSTLTATITLTPKKKFGLGFNVNVSQSNIQTVGVSFSSSLLARNIFRGAETLEISAIGAIGASKDGGNNDAQQFFDINEIGADIKLRLPRLFFPLNTNKIIPKHMAPITQISLGFTSQTNIGLDKQTVNGIFNYKWFSSNRVTNSLDVFNTQYVRNLNPGNYFSVYQNSFSRLENIALENYNTPSNYISVDADGNESLIKDTTDNFMNLVLQDAAFKNSNPQEYQEVNNIKERKDRLTENNLIVASNFSYAINKKENVFDKDFSIFKAKIELAGNLLSSASQLLDLQKNTDDRYEIFGVNFSQYVKTEFDYVKYWNAGRNNVIALKTFFGIAIPFGNSTSIPFSKSFFAGGTNDNRAWTAYNLGPGSSDSNNQFNEANMKIAFNIEHRYAIFGSLDGAFFVDIGNIWNVLDDVDDANATFSNFESIKDIAIGSGFGLRYDFGFVVGRFDIGFKTYDPSYPIDNRWFNDYNFSKAVYNIGINYPF
ncbi:MAG: BamA/TamA family outer membrane protein [Flavobacteriaceae bacterium]|nr:BamA/TamA family outer membrane protein [Flavobacteriaceae bacterium]